MSQVEKLKPKDKKLPIVWVERIYGGEGFLNQFIGIAEKINPDFEIHEFKDIQIGSCKGKNPDIIISACKPELDMNSAISKKRSKIFYITGANAGGDLVYGDSSRFFLPKNYVKIIGVPHAVTQEKIRAGKAELGSQFSGLPHPQIAVLLGGDCAGFDFTPEKAKKMAQEIVAKVKKLGGSLIITTSNRTGDKATAAFMGGIEKEQHVPTYLHDWRLEAAKGNPYFGFLGLADAIIVSGDSGSMCCEANMSRKPVYIYAPEGTRKEDSELHQQLYDRNLAKPFSEFLAKGIEHWDYEPLDAAGDIAKEALRRWRAMKKPCNSL